jgi:hypothetical protein
MRRVWRFAREVGGGAPDFCLRPCAYRVITRTLVPRPTRAGASGQSRAPALRGDEGRTCQGVATEPLVSGFRRVAYASTIKACAP